MSSSCSPAHHKLDQSNLMIFKGVGWTIVRFPNSQRVGDKVNKSKKYAHQIRWQGVENTLKLFFQFLQIVRTAQPRPEHQPRQLQNLHFVRNLCELCQDVQHVWLLTPQHCKFKWCMSEAFPCPPFPITIRESRRVSPEQSSQHKMVAWKVDLPKFQ